MFVLAYPQYVERVRLILAELTVALRCLHEVSESARQPADTLQTLQGERGGYLKKRRSRCRADRTGSPLGEGNREPAGNAPGREGGVDGG